MEYQTNQEDKCLFYQENHCYPGCKKSLALCSAALEYTLSLNTPNVVIVLTTRLAKSMPVVTCYEETKVFEKLEESVSNRNFIIHEASEVAGFQLRQVDNMTFFVTYLKKNGHSNETRTRIWVTANITNNLICHKLRKHMFVYEKIVLGKRE